MKRLKFLGLAIIAIAVACGDDDNTSPRNNNQQLINTIVADMVEGSWRITTYVDNGVAKTGNFESYTFTFADNGSVTAVKEETSISGFWSVTDDLGTDDDPGSDLDFNLAFNLPPAFVELTDDWDINERNANRISLIDESGGNGGTDILVFEKIQ